MISRSKQEDVTGCLWMITGLLAYKSDMNIFAFIAMSNGCLYQLLALRYRIRALNKKH